MIRQIIRDVSERYDNKKVIINTLSGVNEQTKSLSFDPFKVNGIEYIVVIRVTDWPSYVEIVNIDIIQFNQQEFLKGENKI